MRVVRVGDFWRVSHAQPGCAWLAPGAECATPARNQCCLRTNGNCCAFGSDSRSGRQCDGAGSRNMPGHVQSAGAGFDVVSRFDHHLLRPVMQGLDSQDQRLSVSLGVRNAILNLPPKLRRNGNTRWYYSPDITQAFQPFLLGKDEHTGSRVRRSLCPLGIVDQEPPLTRRLN